MSSLGGQWRVLRHYLSLSNLHAEAEKLVQRLRPASPDQWDKLIERFEKAISRRLQLDKQLESSKPAVQATATEDVGTAESQVGKEKPEPASPAPPAELEGSSSVRDISIEGLLLGLKRRKDLHFGNVPQPGWKDNKPLVNKSSIHSRTAYVISALVSARSAASLAARAADLVQHVHHYPEARDLAIKEGAVRALLRVRHRLRAEPRGAEGDHVRGIINEALALMGYCDPPGSAGPRILALDGGGIRGLVAIEILQHLERLTGRRVNELFDFIVGVSTGAIIAAAIGSGAGTLEMASRMYVSLSREMFANTTLLGGTSRLVWTHSYYDTELWEKMLRDSYGEITLSECNRRDNPKMALVSCVVNPEARLSPFVFRTYECGFRVRGAVRGTSAARVWQAVRASAAAPTYFAEFRLGGLVHQDGGLMANNPAGLALHEARLVFGAAALQRATIVSVGTGRAPAPAPAARPAPQDEPRGTTWRDKFYKILDSATDTESVHLLLNDLLPPDSYYRLNPPLLAPCAMDEIDPARLAALVADARAYCRRNQGKLARAAARLAAPRPLAMRAADAVRQRAIMLGLTTHH